MALITLKTAEGKILIPRLNEDVEIVRVGNVSLFSRTARSGKTYFYQYYWNIKKNTERYVLFSESDSQNFIKQHNSEIDPQYLDKIDLYFPGIITIETA